MNHSAEEYREALKKYMLTVVDLEGIFFIDKGFSDITDELIDEIENDWMKEKIKQDNCIHAYQYKGSNFDDTQHRHVCKYCNKEKWIKQ